MDETVNNILIEDPIALHLEVKKQAKPNFIGARIPVPSHMNVDVWKQELRSYWDKQFVEFLRFGFPLGFNCKCELKHTEENHKSAEEFPDDVVAYLKEEVEQKAIYGPLKENPIIGGHVSPFMTCHKPDSNNRSHYRS